MDFIVWGKVSRVSRASLTLLSWAFANEADAAANENPDNVKSFTIVRKAIISLVYLVPEPPLP